MEPKEALERQHIKMLESLAAIQGSKIDAAAKDLNNGFKTLPQLAKQYRETIREIDEIKDERRGKGMTLYEAMRTINGRRAEDGRLSKEMQEILMAHGLNKQQAASTTASTIISECIPTEGQELIKEAAAQVKKASERVDEYIQHKFNMEMELKKLKHEIEDLEKKQEAVREAKIQIAGDIEDKRAKTAISLFSALIQIAKTENANADMAIQSAGYIAYAYLGGQAKREIEIQNNRRQR